jgi:hypothetical protein
MALTNGLAQTLAAAIVQPLELKQLSIFARKRVVPLLCVRTKNTSLVRKTRIQRVLADVCFAGFGTELQGKVLTVFSSSHYQGTNNQVSSRVLF